MAAQSASAYAAVPAAPPPGAPSVPVQSAGAPPPVQPHQAAAAAVAAVAAQAQAQQAHAQQAQSAAHSMPVPQPHPGVAHAMPAAFTYPANMVFAAPDTGLVEDQPTYVNPKQYARILKRRESRKKQTGTDVTSYTPRKRSYMHESRHKHAMQRRRGPGGRFLSKQERADLNAKESESNKSAASAGGAADTASKADAAAAKDA